MEFLIYFIVLALLAEIIGTVGGFGSSMLFIPIASYFLDFHVVLGITAIYHVSSNLSKIYFFKEGFDKKLLLEVGIPSVVFVIIGAFLSKYVPGKTLEFLLAIFLICLSLLLLIFKNFILKPNTPNSIIGGALSGFIAGLLGTGGAIRGIVLSSYNLKPNLFIATSAMIDLGIDVSRSIVYTSNGFLQKKYIYLIPILIVISIVGTYIGKRIVNLLTEKQFKTTVLFLILATGIFTLIKSFNS